ncbi:unnamed protein product, partial [Cladocopium goreaui]
VNKKILDGKGVSVDEGGVKVKLRLNPQRGRSTADLDPPLAGIIDAMAERKLVTVSAAKGYAALKKTLLRAAWYTMTRVYWEKWAFHIMERDHTSLPEIENRAKTLWEILLGEGTPNPHRGRRFLINWSNGELCEATSEG